VTDIDELLETTASVIRDELTTRPGPPAAAITRRLRTRRRRRRGVAVVITVAATVGIGIGYTGRDTTDLQTAAEPADEPADSDSSDTSSTSDSDDGESPDEPPADAGPDLTRTLLPPPIGGDQPRFVRTWTLSMTERGSHTLLSEQWYERDGTAHGSSTPLSDPAQGLTIDDQGPEAWVDLGNVPLVAYPLGEETGDSDFGYPERHLAGTVPELAAQLANPDGPGAGTPGVFMSVTSAGGTDGSYLPPEGTTVRELVRLLPTIMEPAHRSAAIAVLRELDGAETRENVDDMIGRTSLLVTVPLELTDSTTGTWLGRLETSFWFHPDTAAPHQIEWQLTDGILPGSNVTQFLDRTVIIAAGEVATIPVFTPPPAEPSVTSTLAPLPPDEAIQEAIACLDLSQNTMGIQVNWTTADPVTGTPTIHISTTRTVFAELTVPGGPADRCSESYGITIDIAADLSAAGDLATFCARFSELPTDTPREYVGSAQHIKDVDILLAAAPTEIFDQIVVYLDYLHSGAVDSVNDPDSADFANWPSDVQTAITEIQAFGSASC